MEFAFAPHSFSNAMPNPHGTYDGSYSSQYSHLSEPLARYGSSEGSYDSLSSSAVASPMMGSEYYAYHASSPAGASPNTQYTQPSPPSTVAYYGSPEPDAELDHTSPRGSTDDRRGKSSQSGRDYPVCCLHPGCTAKPFKRRADLDRHYKHRHAPDSQKESFNCDYPRCARRLDPFRRLDHFRDHLREFHKEDIEKRGGSINEEWLEDRHVSSSWWRCSKCLKRVYIERNGYECPGCKTTCQAKRKEARRRE
ncbi:hypothetical protein JDV02_007206 [Purpureocillium takamizusanense]|uniref:Egg shell protein n=1 Tax=Purpureocillium takamizusanense TaxID=2060973 RepID=A0A9Q8QKC9_9HYPO|nr:uncharacterized protein JDV02_007206 [Purpureocillium takamizusanense]UNI21195.1 hypothetical protein JDV02_007206 [Purpureocillium takamizusanense]